MSHDLDESSLEEALRNDLPSTETERRLRLRLLAAGVAIGNGIATTTAAAGTAAAGATTSATAAGVFGKVLGLSWGIKLGVAAAVAIPAVGLLLEPAAPAPAAQPAALVASPAAKPQAPQPVEAARDSAPAGSATAAAPLSPEPVLERSSASGTRGTSVEAVATAAPTPAAHPSRSDFAALEPPPRAPQVGSTLADETRLLDAVFAAIGAGERARAARLIAEHEARYPSGLLKRERERAKTKLSDLSRGE